MTVATVMEFFMGKGDSLYPLAGELRCERFNQTLFAGCLTS
jgi:hypothetical protein